MSHVAFLVRTEGKSGARKHPGRKSAQESASDGTNRRAVAQVLRWDSQLEECFYDLDLVIGIAAEREALFGLRLRARRR
jgi:hypothetical protein